MSIAPSAPPVDARSRPLPPPRGMDQILEDILAELKGLSKTLRGDVLRQEFYTTGEAAALLKCSAFTIRRWIKTGVLQAEKLRTGKQQDSYRIAKEALVKVIEADQVPHAGRRRASAAG